MTDASEEVQTELVIPEDVARYVNEARDAGKPMVFCYIAPDGRPVASVRGSVHVHSSHELSMWVRHAGGDLAQAIAVNPNVVMLYRDNDDRNTFTLNGRARIVDDEAAREQVYLEGPPGEAPAHDPERKGAAMIIDLDSIEGGNVRVKGPQVTIRRSADTKVWSPLYPEA
jgi:Pyridoxamine 5'-phosphate oxidase